MSITKWEGVEDLLIIIICSIVNIKQIEITKWIVRTARPSAMITPAVSQIRIINILINFRKQKYAFWY